MPQIKLMITRSEFRSIMEKIETQKKTDDAFSAALNLVCDGYPVYGSKNKYKKHYWNCWVSLAATRTLDRTLAFRKTVRFFCGGMPMI